MDTDDDPGYGLVYRNAYGLARCQAERFACSTGVPGPDLGRAIERLRREARELGAPMRIGAIEEGVRDATEERRPRW